MISKINFKYSPIYQEVLHLLKGFNYNKKKDWSYVDKFLLKLIFHYQTRVKLVFKGFGLKT